MLTTEKVTKPGLSGVFQDGFWKLIVNIRDYERWGSVLFI